eukprot:Skav208709  [mRNA]  locus=scaffold42:632306:633400:- [translate_table: standard]
MQTLPLDGEVWETDVAAPSGLQHVPESPAPTQMDTQEQSLTATELEDTPAKDSDVEMVVQDLDDESQANVPEHTLQPLPESSQALPEDSLQDSKLMAPEGKDSTEVPAEEAQDPSKMPEPEKEPDFPMVTREDQQTFKDKVNKVAKSDAAAEAEVKRSARDPPGESRGRGRGRGKGRGQGPVRKRPASSKADAEQIEDSEDEASKKNLKAEFDKVAGPELEDTKDDEEKAEASEKTKRKRAPASESRASAKAKAKAEPKAPKTAPKAAPKQKKDNEDEAAAPEEKEGPKRKRAKDDKGKGKSDKGAEEEKGEEPSKATFAGRACKGDASAQWRFRAMRKVFKDMVAVHMVHKPGNAEDLGSKST